MTLDLARTRFPYFLQNREILVEKATVIAKAKLTPSPQVAIVPGQEAPDLTKSPWTGQDKPGPWTFGTDVGPKEVEDVFVIFEYNAFER
jgi:hypothetical protein